ncbi:MAG TPA: GFA family protein [Hyphomicrobium sp.]
MAIKGGCLCGEVRYECAEESGGGHCHCIDCRKSSGTGHGSHMIVPEEAFKIGGEVRFFDKPADSGNIVSRGFCPTCGSPVYSRNSGMPGMVFVRASSLDDPEAFKPQMVVYTDRAASWDRMDLDLPRFAAMPVLEDRPAALQGDRKSRSGSM